ncbi:hypothetical protein BDP27DRAFT_1309950 [Rhodocollybia butyracea]|uniref:Uncharacterized protein n=1 Tax=Rhodocollybia butyracea TaxID=206335 RepID=A0A9P5QBV9_9AGAR|nr:hypothetical protein BDP27DRAFT_1309950 [Rhodocollybia butyracea]
MNLYGDLEVTIDRLLKPQTLDFSDVNRQTLNQMNIVPQCFLKLKSGIEERIEKSKLSDRDEFWSSTQMYLHLTLLERVVSRECNNALTDFMLTTSHPQNEATSRAWIDTFLFRASTMVAPGKRMIFNMDQSIPSTTVDPSSLITISGHTDYMAVIAEDRVATAYLENPFIDLAKLLRSGFVVTKAQTTPLSEYLPRVVFQLYASAKQLETYTIRGALTNGREWQFIILSINKGGNGASYKFSPIIDYSVLLPMDGGDPKPLQSRPDVIAGILSDWVRWLMYHCQSRLVW